MIVIRKARKSDSKEVIKLHRALGKHEHKLDKLVIPTYLCEPVKTVTGRNVAVFVAEDDGEIVGFAAGSVKRESSFREKIGHYNDCYVRKDYPRNGISKKLTKEMLKWFKSKGVKYVELFVSSKNKVGIKTWSSFGFKEIGKFMRKRI